MYCRLLHFSTLHCKLSTSQGVPYILYFIVYRPQLWSPAACSLNRPLHSGTGHLTCLVLHTFTISVWTFKTITQLVNIFQKAFFHLFGPFHCYTNFIIVTIFMTKIFFTFMTNIWICFFSTEKVYYIFIGCFYVLFEFFYVIKTLITDVACIDSLAVHNFSLEKVLLIFHVLSFTLFINNFFRMFCVGILF